MRKRRFAGAAAEGAGHRAAATGADHHHLPPPGPLAAPRRPNPIAYDTRTPRSHCGVVQQAVARLCGRSIGEESIAIRVGAGRHRVRRARLRAQHETDTEIAHRFAC
jgi:hypothetical protein